MKKINKESLQKFEEKIKEYKYYRIEDICRLYLNKNEVNLQVTFFNNKDNKDNKEYDNFDFTIKFFDNKFRPKYFPKYEIYHTYKSPVAFISMSDETHSLQEDVIIDDETGIEMKHSGDITFKLEFETKIPENLFDCEEEYFANDMRLDLLEETDKEYANNEYKLYIQKAKINMLKEIDIDEFNCITQIFQMPDIIDNVFDNQEMEDFYYEKLDQVELTEAVYNMVKNIIKRIGDNNLDDYEYSLFFKKDFISDKVGIKIINKQTGEEI